MYFVVVYAHSGLSPVRERPCRANKTAGLLLIEKQHSPAVYFELFLHVQQLGPSGGLQSIAPTILWGI